MSTPLYKKMKNGSSFYTFPSSSMYPNPNFSKFVLLNIPTVIDDNNIDDIPGRLDFEYENFQNMTFGIYSDFSPTPEKYSEQLVSSLRNYVANHDETMRNSRITTTKDFYNIKELQTPTEMIFWKWLRKNNAIEFEVAEHKKDWNKNHPDFDNKKTTAINNTDYFRKYLWKEREVNNYTINTISGIGPVTYNGVLRRFVVDVIINYHTNFKVGDRVLFTKSTGTIVPGEKYVILEISIDEDNQTHIYINVPDFEQEEIYNEDGNLGYIKLDYNRLIQYVGEINLKSDVRTARKDETEVMAYIPHQAGRTPTVLFTTRFDTNYRPNLELPILPEQIQSEILGAENLNSPIRKYPELYSGTYIGQFDTNNKTYETSNGDSDRLKGDYFGILRNNNINLSDDNYVESNVEFDSKNLDGINIDFNLKHYLKMSISETEIGFNFDEFNQLVVDGVPPQNFEYNAILWYYDVNDDNSKSNNVYTNLYGITFLNNPDNSTTYKTEDGVNVINREVIDTYKKLVSNDEHDGLSYIHTLNIMTSVDENVKSMSFDPLTINNNFGFEVYQNVMTNVAKLNESYLNMINSFLTMNTDLNNMKSVIYTQTDINKIKDKLDNLEKLLHLYEKYQFINTDTVSITTNYSDTYPTLAFNVKNTEYSSIYNINITDIFEYYSNNVTGYKIIVPESNKVFIKITNDNKINTGEPTIIFNRDLEYKQIAELYIDTKEGFKNNKLNINMNYFNSTVEYPQNKNLISIFTPNDIGSHSDNNKTYNKTHYNNTTISQNINLIKSLGTTMNPYTILYTTTQNCFGSSAYEESVFIDNFIFVDDNNNFTNESGMYNVGKNVDDFNQVYFKIKLNTFNKRLVGVPVAYLIKSIKITIIRINESNTSSITDRYLIQKTYL